MVLVSLFFWVIPIDNFFERAVIVNSTFVWIPWDNNNTTGVALTSLLWFISWKKGWKKYDIPEYLQHIRKRWSRFFFPRSFEDSFRTVYLQNDITTHSHLYNMWKTHIVTVSIFQNTQIAPILIAFFFLNIFLLAHSRPLVATRGSTCIAPQPPQQMNSMLLSLSKVHH